MNFRVCAFAFSTARREEFLRQRQTAAVGWRDDPRLQHVWSQQLRHCPAAAAADTSKQEAVLCPHHHRGKQTRPAAAPQRLWRGGTVARPVPTVWLLRGVRGGDVPRRPAGVSPPGRPRERDTSYKKKHGRRPRDRQERVCSVCKETGGVDSTCKGCFCSFWWDENVRARISCQMPPEWSQRSDTRRAEEVERTILYWKVDGKAGQRKVVSGLKRGSWSWRPLAQLAERRWISRHLSDTDTKFLPQRMNPNYTGGPLTFPLAAQAGCSSIRWADELFQHRRAWTRLTSVT